MFSRYIEIASDGYANRQVDVYENGYTLRYDRDQWVDDFDMLADANVDKLRQTRQKADYLVEMIEVAEFERVWEDSKTAPNQPQRYDMSQFADVPKRLQRTKEQIRRLPPWIANLFNDNRE
ncbi:MAG TPA: hypothetical protein VNQ76_11680 [Planctomicrobium sp.]|nr:hypothetical protein [Planctomicrobium sp.]